MSPAAPKQALAKILRVPESLQGSFCWHLPAA
jgi:hypothetical protein